MLLGGGFGRRRAADFGVDAAVLSMRSGRPVKLIYSREDDLAAGHYRPAAVARFEASLDGAGGPPRLSGHVVTAAAGDVPTEVPLDVANASPIATDRAAGSAPYDLANWDVATRLADTGVPVSEGRSSDHSNRVFFVESFIDELAATTGHDACELRRALVTDARCRRVLDLVADRSDWGRPLPAGVGRGIALASCFGSVIAEVAEVSVGADGRPKVHRFVAAVDCGWTVNPQIVRRQVEGAIHSGLSAALHGRISYENGRVQESNFDTYALLRIADAPRIDIHLVPSRDPPGGAGALGTLAVAPALLNAIFNATGRRLRTLPVDPKRLMPLPAS
jgi:isoquinoline 1-oxidoreductase beta subunit